MKSFCWMNLPPDGASVTFENEATADVGISEPLAAFATADGVLGAVLT